jgi:Zn ribbon nucleic-acid-binding protein
MMDNQVVDGVVTLRDEKGPAKCPECGATDFEMRNYEMMWHEGDIHCARCGKFIRRFDAG